MSAGMTNILPPAALAKLAVFSSSATRRPVSTTEYPADCKAILAPRPIPLPAPVTSATLLVFIIVIFPSCRARLQFSAGILTDKPQTINIEKYLGGPLAGSFRVGP
jgi:hypothetical protein